MAQFDTLPADIHVEILCSLHHIDDLSALVVACRSALDAFQQHRQTILKTVFSNYLAGLLQPAATRKSGSRRDNMRQLINAGIELAEKIIRRCRSSATDAFYLHHAAWQTMLYAYGPEWLSCPWSLRLCERYVNVHGVEKALPFCQNLWDLVRKENHRYACAEEVSHAGIAQKLAVMLVNGKAVDQACQVIKQYYQNAPNLRHYGMMATLMSFCRNSDQSTQQSLLLFFCDQVEKEKSALQRTGYRYVPGRTTAAQHHWTFCLSILHAQLGQHEQAHQVMHDALDFAILHHASMSTVIGLSRQLIKLHREAKELEMVIAVRLKIQDMLQASPNDPSQYLAWTSELTHDLQLLGRKDEAVQINEIVWQALQTQVGNDSWMLFHLRNAAWALAKCYERVDKVEDARRVQQQHEVMAQRSNVTTSWISWPGKTNLTASTSSLAQRDLEIPIMVPRYDG